MRVLLEGMCERKSKPVRLSIAMALIQVLNCNREKNCGYKVWQPVRRLDRCKLQLATNHLKSPFCFLYYKVKQLTKSLSSASKLQKAKGATGWPTGLL